MGRVRDPRFVVAAVAALIALLTALPARPDPLDSVLDDLAYREEYVKAFSLAVQQLAERRTRLGLRDPGTLASLHRVGSIALDSGDSETAEIVLDLALTLRREVLGNRSLDVAETLYRRGLAAKVNFDRPLARRCYDEALGIATARADTSRMAEIMFAQGLLLRFPDRQRLLDTYARALALRRKAAGQSPSIDIVDYALWLSWFEWRAGHMASARDHLRLAREQLEAVDPDGRDRRHWAHLYHFEADLHLIDGQWSDAERLLRHVVAIDEERRASYLPGFSRNMVPLNSYEPLVWALLEQGRYQEAWGPLLRAHAPLSLDFLLFSHWRELAPESYDRVRSLRAEYLAADRDLHRGGVTPAVLSTEQGFDSLLQVLTLEAKLNEIESDFLAAHRHLDIDYTAFQKSIPGNTALIGWIETPLGYEDSGTTGPVRWAWWLYVIRSSGPVQWTKVWESSRREDARVLYDRMGDYYRIRERAAAWPMRVAADPKVTASARELGRVLLDPALPHLAGIENVVVATGVQTFFPIEALLGPDGRPWSDRFTITYLPSVADYPLMRGDRRPVARTGDWTALIVAPVGGGADSPLPAGIGVLPSSVRFPQRTVVNRADDLPHSRREADRIGELFGQSLELIGEDASEARLDALARSGQLASYRVIHIASHVFRGPSPDRCGLLLAPAGTGQRQDPGGYLDARRIAYTWELGAEVLTLSGCQSARGSFPSGKEYLGLPQAMLATGARSVVTSFFDVDDDITEHLMERFYEDLTGRHRDERLGRRAQPMPRALALREARTWLREYVAPDGTRPYANPAYWSSFMLTGAGD